MADVRNPGGTSNMKKQLQMQDSDRTSSVDDEASPFLAVKIILQGALKRMIIKDKLLFNFCF